ncbi:STY4534 family ICE replication protein [Pseudomonas bijieensis]|uniref:STY4534 family ICE replication protein n=1 Tax=Pseudomonas bijieensis TaxID=2681983 RepID=UPI00200CD4B2|nr:STY4534 family ICE replication protein [Pseudomonas bijieensis]UQI28525.1 STY4534 family ICE replication protein [Pseudomonas bijieensis]
MSNVLSETKYFDLHVTGLGYLNRIREVKLKKGESFLACDIAALNGPTDCAEYRRFDVRVTGEDAQHIVRRLAKVVELERKVLVGFRLGDPWVDTFTYSKGINQGQTGVSFKARLLLLNWVKVDGVLVYKREPSNQDSPAPGTSTPTIAPSPQSSSEVAPL